MLDKMRPLACRVFILVVTHLVACNEPVPVHLSAIGDDADDEELVVEAFDTLGLPFEFTNRVRGTIHLTLIDPPVDQTHGGGVTAVRSRCHNAVVAQRRVRTIAHELGHALGLDHTCEAPCPDEHMDFLMNGEWGEGAGISLSDEEFDELDRGRRRLTRCR